MQNHSQAPIAPSRVKKTCIKENSAVYIVSSARRKNKSLLKRRSQSGPLSPVHKPHEQVKSMREQYRRDGYAQDLRQEQSTVNRRDLSEKTTIFGPASLTVIRHFAQNFRSFNAHEMPPY